MRHEIKRIQNIKENTIVYRAVNNFFSSEIGIGSKFYFGEFILTTLNKRIARDFVGNQGTLMTIILKNNGNKNYIKNNGNNNYLNYCCSFERFRKFRVDGEVIITSHCSYIVTDITKKGEIDYVNLICEGYLLSD